MGESENNFSPEVPDLDQDERFQQIVSELRQNESDVLTATELQDKAKDIFRKRYPLEGAKHQLFRQSDFYPEDSKSDK